MITDWIDFGSSLSIWKVLLRLVVAVLIGAVVGIEREKKNRPAGMRTHVLVCVGAALIAMVEQQMVADVADLANSQINVSVGRITSAVVSGVGFLGAGTIVLSDHKIIGLTTAASLWCIACIGVAIGAGYTTIAVVTGVIVLVVLNLMQKIVHVHTYKRLEVQFVHRAETLTFLRTIFAEMKVHILDTDFHATTNPNGKNLYTNVYTLTIPNDTSYSQIIDRLSEYENIRAVVARNV